MKLMAVESLVFAPFFIHKNLVCARTSFARDRLRSHAVAFVQCTLAGSAEWCRAGLE